MNSDTGLGFVAGFFTGSVVSLTCGYFLVRFLERAIDALEDDVVGSTDAVENTAGAEPDEHRRQCRYNQHLERAIDALEDDVVGSTDAVENTAGAEAGEAVCAEADEAAGDLHLI